MLGGRRMLAIGSRAQVWHGTAKATGYGRKGLRKSQLKKNKHGRIVSRRMSGTAKKQDRLGRAGWKTRRGVFGSYHVDQGRTRRRRRRGRRTPRTKRCRHKSGPKKGKFKRC